ncbi:flagellin N-terminal helical domain-containing protein [Azohydromonas australica]|uniref:flagellin N-terminal helical domain-containing protein n=1 Tax=Azohydromonas australica TaxID=364039 RepID=UPI0004172732|nr:flagellin [Azohydromonas australica]
MGMSVNTNLSSLNAQRNISSSQGSLATSMQRLSSGLRVNSAKDDSAGLAIAERMTAQVKGMNAAIRNANDGISMVQTMEAAYGKIGDSLQRMRELAVQSANDSNSTSDRVSLDKEFGKLAEEINRVLGGTTFNGKSILGANAGAGLTMADVETAYRDNTAVPDNTTITDPTSKALSFQIGANISTDDHVEVKVNNYASTHNGITAVTGFNASQELTATWDMNNDGDNTNDKVAAGSAMFRASITGDADATRLVIDDLDTAIDLVNEERANLGAYQSRFDSIISNLQSASEAQSAAKSRIMDADYATETSNLSRSQILQQAGQAMLAQANQQPQQVMSLLR